MSSESEYNSADNGSSRPLRKTKRRKLTHKGRAKPVELKEEEPVITRVPFETLLKTLHEQTAEDWSDKLGMRDSFDAFFEQSLYEFVKDVEDDLMVPPTRGGMGPRLLSRQETSHLRELTLPARQNGETSVLAALLAAKSRTHSRIFRRIVLNRDPPYTISGPLTSLGTPRRTPAANPEVLDALYAVRTTPYDYSFLSRVCGFSTFDPQCVLAVDWDTCTPWMDLMADIREHHALAHPKIEQSDEAIAPVTYCTMQVRHINQVHALLANAFWDGINVSDAFDYSPEKCTVVATYKQLVVGAAILSSPQETYITYLVVRPGWDNSHIATSMLYHLIMLNPHKDITLHVSINNPAMLLYNRFGFKAEEFIVGFYEDYLNPNSPQSKNAFRLRLRRW